MHLPDAPIVPAESLNDEDLIHLFTLWGRCGKIAVRRALATLPEIIRRRLFRRTTASPYEFAHKLLGVSRAVVDRVLLLHQQIGHMPELWALLATGAEGWSKLEVVAGVATPDTAAWWAERVVRCSTAELRELVRRLKAQQSATEETRPDLPLLAGIEDQGPAAPATPEPRDGLPPGDQGPAAGGGPLGQPAMPLTDRSAAPIPERTRAATSQASRAQAPAVASGADAPPDASAAQAASEAPGMHGESIPGKPDPGTAGSPVLGQPKLKPVIVYLTPEDEDLLRAWQAQLRRIQGETVSLGEVVGLLLRGHRPGSLPGTGEAIGDGSLASEVEPGRETGREADGESDRAASREAGREPDSLARSTSLPLGRGPADELALAPKRVEVLVRATGVPGSWAGKLMGVLPAGIAAAFKAGETFSLEDLYLAAVEAARRHKGDHIPFAVRKFVALRAGFRCETGGCDAPMHDLDHDTPRAEGGSHHPDGVHARCHKHHRMRHKKLFADIAGGVAVQPGSPDLSSPADRAYQAISAKVQSGPS